MGSSILNREKGFTLLEVVFACAILGMGILGYSKIKASSRYSRIYAKQLSQATVLSSSQLEDFIVLGYKSSLLEVPYDVGEFTYHYADLGGDLSIGDFRFKDVRWTVRKECPTPLTKIVKFDGYWGNYTDIKDAKNIELFQVQVRP